MEKFVCAIFGDTPMRSHRIAELNTDSIITEDNDEWSNENLRNRMRNV